jgi:hypothetical protein
MLMRQHGERAAELAAQRSKNLESAGDADGTAMWRRIADCIERLSQPGMTS